MAQTTLSPSKVYHPLDPIGSRTLDEFAAVEFDFRNPEKFTRDLVSGFDELHKTFARTLAGELSQAVRDLVRVEPLATEQVSYESYLRTLPSPTALTLVSMPPLPGGMALEMDALVALVLIDRLLGGPGMVSGSPRRLTELESSVYQRVVEMPIAAIADTFSSILEVSPTAAATEFNPQFVHLVAPTETVLLLTFLVSIQGSQRNEGILTLCYPYTTFEPVIESLRRRLWAQPQLGENGEDENTGWVKDGLATVPLSLVARLRPTLMDADQLAGLRPGDVVVLEHLEEEPVEITVEGRSLLNGHLGRRGNDLAVWVSGWSAP